MIAMGSKFRSRRYKKTPLGSLTVTHSRVYDSIRTPFRTAIKRLTGGGRSSDESAGIAGSMGLLGPTAWVIVSVSGLSVLAVCALAVYLPLDAPRESTPKRQAAEQNSTVIPLPLMTVIEPEASAAAEQPIAVTAPVDTEAEPDVEWETATESAAVTVESLPTEELKLPKREKREWTDKAGHSVIATLLDVTDTLAQLQRAHGGKPVVIPIKSLSKADQNYITYVTTPRYDQNAEILIGKASQIMEGDTFKLDVLGATETTIRLVGVDAPELDQPFGNEARIWLTEKTDGQILRVELKDKDQEGRSLGDVYIGARWLNHELLIAGLAWHEVKSSQDIRLAQAQLEARSKFAGIWRSASLVAPWDYRNGVMIETWSPNDADSIGQRDDTVYITDSGTKYHRKECRYAKRSKAIPLSQAVSAYQPCAVCKP